MAVVLTVDDCIIVARQVVVHRRSSGLRPQACALDSSNICYGGNKPLIYRFAEFKASDYLIQAPKQCQYKRTTTTYCS